MFNEYQRPRVLIITGTLVCFVMFWLLTGWLTNPATRLTGLSLLNCPGGLSLLIACALTMAVGTGISVLITGSVRQDAGLFCAAVGWSALSIRGGTLGQLLLVAPSPKVFIYMAIETILLGLILGIGWCISRQMHQRGWSIDDSERDFLSTEHPARFNQTLPAVGLQIAVMTMVMLILCQSDAKNQVLACVAISAWAGTAAANSAMPISPGGWFLIGPVVVGVLGYIACSFNPEGYAIGQTSGFFSALARPLPIDYLSSGPAGALIGYWLSRKWHSARNNPAGIQTNG